MQRKMIPDSQNRLLILYALDHLGPVTDAQLLTFMVERDLMNYFSLQLGLGELQDQGNICRKEHPNGPLLQVTDSGSAMLGEFTSRLPASRRETVDTQAQEYRLRFRLQQQTPAETVQLPDGSQCLRLRLLQNGRTLLDVLYTLPQGMRMNLVNERWRSVSGAIYCELTAALMSSDSEVQGELPASTCIQSRRDGDWILSLSGGTDAEPMVILLSLPTEQVAQSCAMQWDACADHFHSLILSRMLQDDQPTEVTAP